MKTIKSNDLFFKVSDVSFYVDLLLGQVGRKGGVVQTLIFDNVKFSVGEAEAWARDHEFKVHNVDQKEGTIRIRQSTWGRFRRFATIELSDGIKAVLGFSSETQYSSFAAEFASYISNTPYFTWTENVQVSLDNEIVKEKDGWVVASEEVTSRFVDGPDLQYISFKFASVGTNRRNLKFTKEFLRDKHETIRMRPLVVAFVGGKPQGHGEKLWDPQPKALGVIYGSKFDGEIARAAAVIWAQRFSKDTTQVLKYLRQTGSLDVSMELFAPKKTYTDAGEIVPLDGNFIGVAIVSTGADSRAKLEAISTTPMVDYFAASMAANNGGILVDGAIKDAKDFRELSASLETVAGSAEEVDIIRSAVVDAVSRLNELVAAHDQSIAEGNERIESLEKELVEFRVKETALQRASLLVEKGCFASTEEIPEELKNGLSSMTETDFLAKQIEILSEKAKEVKEVAEAPKGSPIEDEHEAPKPKAEGLKGKMKALGAYRAKNSSK